MTNEGNTTMELNVGTKINNDSTIVDRYTTDNINNNVDNKENAQKVVDDLKSLWYDSFIRYVEE